MCLWPWLGCGLAAKSSNKAQDEPSLQQAGCAKGHVSSEAPVVCPSQPRQAPRLSILPSFQVCSTPDCCVITALLQR